MKDGENMKAIRDDFPAIERALQVLRSRHGVVTATRHLSEHAESLEHANTSVPYVAMPSIIRPTLSDILHVPTFGERTRARRTALQTMFAALHQLQLRKFFKLWVTRMAHERFIEKNSLRSHHIVNSLEFYLRYHTSCRSIQAYIARYGRDRLASLYFRLRLKHAAFVALKSQSRHESRG